MFENIRRFELNSKGFTLMELLITFAIIAILGAIVIPGYLGVQKRSKRAAVVGQAKVLAQELSNMLNAAYSLSPSLVEGTIDWNGDGQIDGNDKMPKNISASKIVKIVKRENRYYFRYNNPFGPEDVFKAGIIVLEADDSARTIKIRGFDADGNLLYSTIVSAE